MVQESWETSPEGLVCPHIIVTPGTSCPHLLTQALMRAVGCLGLAGRGTCMFSVSILTPQCLAPWREWNWN